MKKKYLKVIENPKTGRKDLYIKHKKTWRLMRRALWAAIHKEPVPQAHDVVLIDGCAAHVTKKNLKLVSNADLMRLDDTEYTTEGLKDLPALETLLKKEIKLITK